MNKFQEMYRAKLKTAEEVAMYVKSGDICACPTGLEEPETICAAVGERARRGEITGVQHHAILSVKGNAFMDPALKGKYDYVSWFTGGAGRKGIQQGYYTYVPNNYSTAPGYWRDCMPRLDVFYAEVSPMDKHGYFSCGMAGAEVVALRDKATIILLEVNEKMPRVMGNNLIHISQVTALCESCHELLELPGFMGFQTNNEVATGLGFGARKGNSVVQALLRDYDALDFLKADGSADLTPCPERNTRVLQALGVRKDGTRQSIAEMEIFPAEYFCPMDFYSRELRVTPKTYSIHRYAESWKPKPSAVSRILQRLLKKHYYTWYCPLRGRIEGRLRKRT